MIIFETDKTLLFQVCDEEAGSLQEDLELHCTCGPTCAVDFAAHAVRCHLCHVRSRS